MKKRIEIETLFGGIAAVFAIIAIIAEIIIDNFSKLSIAGGIKDFSTTLVAVIVLIIAVRKLKPKRTRETYESVLYDELDKWVKHSMPLVHRAKDYTETIRFYMITNLDKVFFTDDKDIQEICRMGSVNSGTFNGKFVDLPNKASSVLRFYLNASTFKNRAKARNENYEDAIQKLSPTIANCISKNFESFCSAGHSSDGKTITVSFKQELSTPEHARELVKLIEYVMTLFVIAA